MGVDLRQRTRGGIGDINYDNSFQEFCKEERNGTAAGRRNGVKIEEITAYL